MDDMADNIEVDMEMYIEKEHIDFQNKLMLHYLMEDSSFLNLYVEVYSQALNKDDVKEVDQFEICKFRLQMD